MTWLWHLLAVPSTLLLVVLAGAQFGAVERSSEFLRLTCLLVPLMAMVLICLRMPSALPSVAIFLFGLVLDLSSEEPLGYWPLVLLVGTALAKLHPTNTPHSLGLRLGWRMVVTAGLLCCLVIIESLYLVRLPEFESFVGAMAVFLATGWVVELLLAVFGLVRLQVPESSNLVRGEK